MLRRRINVAVNGTKKYGGDAGEICGQIIRECWNGQFFQASTGHFCQFWTRDFGICADSLIKLGYRNEAVKTIGYAMDVFSKQGRITTAVTPKGKAFDFPCYAADSLPFLVRSLRVSKAADLVETHRDFLNREIKKFYEEVIDKDTGLVKKNRRFSSMKDLSVRQSSCYDNAMAAMLGNELRSMKKLENPLRKTNFRKLIKKYFWNSEFFLDDLSGKSYVAADANIFPFWTGLFDEKGMIKKAFDSMQREGLDRPFPVKYTRERQKMIFVDFLARGYEAGKEWTNMGPLYIALLKKTNRAEAESHMDAYRKIIESYKNYLEVFDEKGKPFKTAFYYSDEGMIWSANFLSLAG